MSNPLYSFTLICVAFQGINSFVYVSRNGIDSNSCGSMSNPCGTLYQISKLQIPSSMNDVSIYVMDGQNSAEISSHIHKNDTGNYHPCLPMPFPSNMNVNLTFDIKNISSMIEWYPNICISVKENLYQNEYLFDGGKSMIINNLIINDYNITNDGQSQYPIIRSIKYSNATIICNHCLFENIISSINNALIWTLSTIKLINAKFVNIKANNLILADHNGNIDNAKRFIGIYDTKFKNITAANCIRLTASSNDVKPKLYINYTKQIVLVFSTTTSSHISLPKWR